MRDAHKERVIEVAIQEYKNSASFGFGSSAIHAISMMNNAYMMCAPFNIKGIDVLKKTIEESEEKIKRIVKENDMRTFAIRIEEVLAKTVLIDAKDLDSAIERVSERHQNGEIEVKEIDDCDIIPSPYADKNGLFLGTEEDKRCYEIVK